MQDFVLRAGERGLCLTMPVVLSCIEGVVVFGDKGVHLQVGLFDALCAGRDSSLSLLVLANDAEDTAVEGALRH